MKMINEMLKETTFDYEMDEDQTDLFSPAHERYTCTFEYDDSVMVTTYQCNPNYATPGKVVVFNCLVSEALYIADDQAFSDTVNGMPFKKAIMIWKSCEQTEYDLTRLYGDAWRDFDYDAFEEE